MQSEHRLVAMACSLALCVFLAAPVAAQLDDRMSFARTIVIESGDTSGDVICFACIYAWLGRRVLPAGRLFAVVALGVGLSFLLELVPLAGFFVFVLVLVVALGAAAVSGFGSVGQAPNGSAIAANPAAPPPVN